MGNDSDPYNQFSDDELRQDANRQKFIANQPGRSEPQKKAARGKLARIRNVQADRKKGKQK